MTSEQIEFVSAVVFAVLFLWGMDRFRRARERKLQKPFLEKYEPFVREHGELFEKITVPMDEADRRKVKNFYNVIFVFCSIFLALIVMLFIFSFPDSILEYFQSAGLVGFCVIVFVWAYNARKRNLANNVKIIIKGVITNKIKY